MGIHRDCECAGAGVRGEASHSAWAAETITQERVREAAQASQAATSLQRGSTSHLLPLEHTRELGALPRVQHSERISRRKKRESKPSVAWEASACPGRRSQQGLLMTQEWG